MDAQRCANTLKPLKQGFFIRKESKRITLAKSKPSTYVLSCLAMFNKVCTTNINFLWAVSFLIELYMPLRSVSLIQESLIGLGFNSQTLNGRI